MNKLIGRLALSLSFLSGCKTPSIEEIVVASARDFSVVREEEVEVKVKKKSLNEELNDNLEHFIQDLSGWLREIKLRKYISDNIDEIIIEDRKRIGLPFFERPKISYDMPIDLALCRGAYDRELNIVLINKNDPRLFLLMKEAGSQIDIVLRHELGHYYSDKLIEDLIPFNRLEYDIQRKIILEGIAEYFGKTSDYTYGFDYLRINDISELLDSAYQAGYELVKPIIDEYGALGIRYLMCNLPNFEQLTNLCDYQEQALQELEMIRNEEKTIDFYLDFFKASIPGSFSPEM